MRLSQSRSKLNTVPVFVQCCTELKDVWFIYLKQRNQFINRSEVINSDSVTREFLSYIEYHMIRTTIAERSVVFWASVTKDEFNKNCNGCIQYLVSRSTLTLRRASNSLRCIEFGYKVEDCMQFIFNIILFIWYLSNNRALSYHRDCT